MTTAPSATLISRGLVKRFPNTADPANPIRALDGITVEIPSEDKLVAIIGPDGAGKSTFMRLLCGLETPDSGTLEVLGVRPDPDDETYAMRIAFMPQTLGLYRNLSCRENLEIFAGLRGFEGEAAGRKGLEKRIAELLAMTGLAGFEERHAGKLSGGMKQKLALASALLKIPDLLILDEPTVGVDPLSRRELWSVVKKMLRETSMRCLFSTAYLDEAQAADRVLLFEEGKLVADDAPGKYLRRAEGLTWERPLADWSEAKAQRFCRSIMRQTRALQAESPYLDAVPRRGGASVTLARRTKESTETLEAQGFVERTPELEDAYALLTFAETFDAARPRPQEAPSSPTRLPEAPVVIRAEGISRKFGSFVAVANTSFEVRKGEIFGLLGPNGAGKTTTFRMLCGLLEASSGQIEVAGSDLSTAKSSVRARIGYVAQKFSLYGKLTVEQNLRYFGRSYGFSGHELVRRIDRMLAEFGLTNRRNALAAALSFGAKRDLSMACGLIHTPEILFLDEATSGADLASRRTFWQRIQTLADNGTTIVVTTHFLEEAEYCDRFLIQDAGKILALGTPREVKHKAASMAILNKNAELDPDEMSIEEAFIAIVESAREAVKAKDKPSSGRAS